MSYMENGNIRFVNQAEVTAAALLNGQSGPDTTASIISGSMVQEFDQQIGIFNSELMGINAKKTDVRADKMSVVSILSGTETEYASKDAQGNSVDIKGIQVNPSQLKELESMCIEYGLNLENTLNNNNGVINVPLSTVKALEEAVDGKLSDLNSTSELKLIHFQSLMDSRKQAMMMLSNMLNSDNSTKMSIVQNLK